MRGPHVITGLALLVSGCADTLSPPAQRTSCPDWTSIDSAPGREWRAQQGWRFADETSARSAYVAITVRKPAPLEWPDWYDAPAHKVLPVGTRFQMAQDDGQPEPGRFGTFDTIPSKNYVWQQLAVRRAWKPHLGVVVTYEVKRPVPVLIGPIGPQIDDQTCHVLPGGGSQIEADLPPGEHFGDYIREIGRRKIR